MKWFLIVCMTIACVNGGFLDFLRGRKLEPRHKRDDLDNDGEVAWEEWNAPVKIGLFVNENFQVDGTADVASKRMDTPIHPMGGSGSGSGSDAGLFFADSSKRNHIPQGRPKNLANLVSKQVDKKSALKTNNNMKKSELTANASKVEVQGEDQADQNKRSTSVTCQGEKEWLQCPQYRLIKINSAFWGRDDTSTCSRSAVAHGRSTDKMCAQDESNTMLKVQNACDGESACELVASQLYFDRTDCPEVYKFLRLNWECAHSESRIKDSLEQDRQAANGKVV